LASDAKQGRACHWQRSLIETARAQDLLDIANRKDVNESRDARAKSESGPFVFVEFRHVIDRHVRCAPTRLRRDAIRIDVIENEKEYQVLAELPGVKKNEIAITINGDEVAVSA